MTTLDPDPPEETSLAVETYLAVDQQSLFYGGTNEQTINITRMAQAGGAPETFVTRPGFLGGMVVNGYQVVWIEEPFVPDTNGLLPPGASAIFTAPAEAALSGGEPVTPTPIAQDLDSPCALAADDAGTYWIDCMTSELLMQPASAPPSAKPKVLARDLDLGVVPDGVLAVADGRLYWVDGGAIRTMPTGGGTPTTIASESDWGPVQIIADDTQVYWRTADNYFDGASDGADIPDRDPGLWRADLGDGSVTQIVGPSTDPFWVLMDADYVYWVDGDDDSLRRLHR